MPNCSSPVVVTGYVPLTCNHRTHDTYMELGRQLLDICPKAVFFKQRLEDCWLAKSLAGRGLNVVQGGKDTSAYYCVQHEKTKWLERAAVLHPDRTLVWVDFGALHLDAVKPEHIAAFLEAVDRQPPDRIVSPSCYMVPHSWDDSTVCWAFCGGVLLVPAKDAAWLHAQCVYERQHKPPTWEVNTWAAVARNYPERFGFYPADHNQLLFTEVVT